MIIMTLVLIGIAAFYQFVVRPTITNKVELPPAGSAQFLCSPQTLEKHVRALCELPEYRSHHNPKALNEAARYITNEWQAMGFEVREQKFMSDNQEYKNLITSFGPKGGQKIVIGAHYDVHGDQPGADDNASAVAGLLELSRLLKDQNTHTKYEIELVAYTLEEEPNYATQTMGSYVHAKSLHDQNATVRLMISIEMIGYFKDEPNTQTFPFPLLKLDYPTVGNYIAIVSNLKTMELTRDLKKLFAEHSKVPVYSINAPKIIPGVDFSDHRSYWKFNYPAAMITDTAFYRNFNYHQKTDTPDTLDYSRMSQVVSGIYGIVKGIT